jgi:hypothetical protein
MGLKSLLPKKKQISLYINIFCCCKLDEKREEKEEEKEENRKKKERRKGRRIRRRKKKHLVYHLCAIFICLFLLGSERVVESNAFAFINANSSNVGVNARELIFVTA